MKSRINCCEPCGTTEPLVKECPKCGGEVDELGDSAEICGYSPILCDRCGHAPCDLSC
jgi:hypothetical protein